MGTFVGLTIIIIIIIIVVVVVMMIAQGYYTHHHHQLANIVHQKLAFKCGLSNGPPMPHYKYEPQSVLENFSNKLYYNRTIMTDRTIHNSRQDTVKLDKSIKEANLVDVAIPNSHNIHSTIAKKLRSIQT
jgi:hypothetical protein